MVWEGARNVGCGASTGGSDRDWLSEWFCSWNEHVRKWLRLHAGVRTADVDDLAQEVFIRAMRYCDHMVVNHPRSYLLRIAENVANEWRSRSSVRQPHEQGWLEDLPIEERDEPENSLARSCVNDHVRAIVKRLPDRQREVLMLHVNDEMTYDEIAEHQGITRRVVARDVYRAYGRLRRALKAENL